MTKIRKSPQYESAKQQRLTYYGYDPKVETEDGVRYVSLTFGTCIKMALAFLLVFGITGLVSGCFALVIASTPS